MVSSHLFLKSIVYQIHQTEYGLDHLALVSEFITETVKEILLPRQVFKNSR